MYAIHIWQALCRWLGTLELHHTWYVLEQKVSNYCDAKFRLYICIDNSLLVKLKFSERDDSEDLTTIRL